MMMPSVAHACSQCDYARISYPCSQQLLSKQQIPTATQCYRVYYWLAVLQAFRGLHDSVRPGRTLPCRARHDRASRISGDSLGNNVLSIVIELAMKDLFPELVGFLLIRCRMPHADDIRQGVCAPGITQSRAIASMHLYEKSMDDYVATTRLSLKSMGRL
jgi:hypothetical protein